MTEQGPASVRTAIQQRNVTRGGNTPTSISLTIFDDAGVDVTNLDPNLFKIVSPGGESLTPAIASITQLIPPASASLLLDSFSTPAFSRIDTSGVASAVMATSELLGDRDATVSTGGSTVTVTQIGFSGTQRIAGSTAGAGQQYTLAYDGAIDSTGVVDINGAFGDFDVPIDLSQDLNGDPLGAFKFSFVNAFTPSNSRISIRVKDAVGGDAVFVSPANPYVNTATDLFYLVSYSEFPGIDFSQVTAIVVQFQDLAGVSMELTSLESAAVGTPSDRLWEVILSVPAPGGIWDDSDNGDYSLTLCQGALTNNDGTPNEETPYEPLNVRVIT